MNKQPIQPAYGSGVTLAPGVATASSAITKGNKQGVLTNTGANLAYIRIGKAGIQASSADYPVPAGAQVVVTKAMDDDTIAHISPLGTTLHYMNAEGF